MLSRLRYYIGTSGWHYDHWREKFYPRGLAKSRWLGFYSEKFSTVELNNSFYRLPSERAFANWRDSSPEEFVFSVKVSRYITHIKRLKNTTEPISNFMARARLLEVTDWDLLLPGVLLKHTAERLKSRANRGKAAALPSPCLFPSNVLSFSKPVISLIKS